MPVPPPAGEPAAWLALSLISGIGPERTRALLREFGSPANALKQSISRLTPFVGPKCAQEIGVGADEAKVAEALEWLAGANNHLITLADDDYPASLLEISDPPAILYAKGNRALLKHQGFAVVGSRNATPGGTRTAEEFSEALSRAGLTIVSGLALGIDAAAHRGGLRGKGSSIAVVGTGLDLVYPARNKALAHELAERGLIVSEFALGTPALATNFPRRNRIISGLSRGVLVVEAALASGSLITARLAGEHGRDVFAIPGSIHSPFSKGCHQLIKDGAKLVDDANDIIVELGLGPATPQSGARSDSETDETDVDPFLSQMGFDPVTIDTLSSRLALPPEQISVKLMEFELNGVVACLPGGAYQRIG